MSTKQTSLRFIAGGIGGIILASLIIMLDKHLSGGASLDAYLKETPLVYPATLILISLSGGCALAYFSILRKKIEDMKKNSELKSEFISTVIHEIRTPLTYTLWATEALRKNIERNLKQADVAAFDKVHESLRELVIATGSFFDMAKMDIGKMGVSIKYLSLSDFEKHARATIDKFSYQAEEKNVTFTYSINVNGKLLMPIDIEKIREVLVNLLENAIRYTAKGQNISCTITNDASWLSIEIADTGIGIPKAEQDHLFKKFYRASNAREAVSAGTGIGLYICYQFVTAHKGTITLDSDTNKGTKFTIKLPLVTKDNITEFMIKS